MEMISTLTYMAQDAHTFGTNSSPKHLSIGKWME